MSSATVDLEKAHMRMWRAKVKLLKLRLELDRAATLQATGVKRAVQRLIRRARAKL